jgi:DNA-binding NarL/FixJ family response regulator
MRQYLIVDDHHLYFVALEREIVRIQGDAVIHHASNLKAALLLLSRRTPYDLVFLDLKLSDSQGVGAVVAIIKAAPGIKVAVVSGYDDPRLMRDVYEAGAIGFVHKGTEPTVFNQALQSLLAGGFYFSAEALAARPLSKEVAGLTPREREVLDELVSGQSTKLIARKLGLAPTTVDKHIDQIRGKVGVATRMQLVARIREISDSL